MEQVLRSTPVGTTPPVRPVDSGSPGTFAAFVEMLGIEVGQALVARSGVVRLEFNGVDFFIAHDPHSWGEGDVAFVCDFGKVPHESRCEILEAVLMANMEIHGPFSPVFAMRPTTQHLVSIATLPLEILDATTTLQALARHVAVVDRWHADHFIDVDEAPR